jgi:hypothetical protein
MFPHQFESGIPHKEVNMLARFYCWMTRKHSLYRTTKPNIYYCSRCRRYFYSMWDGPKETLLEVKYLAEDLKPKLL